MSTQALPKVATRHECSLAHTVGMTHNHTSGTGAPKRKRCAYCGGGFVIHTGYYGVFVHSSVSGDARYHIESAVSLHTTESAAQRVIDADTTGTLVTRWVVA